MDKGLKRILKGRTSIAAAIVVCLLIVALPTVAFAATFGASYPNAVTLGGQPGQVGVQVISPSSAIISGHISINGTAYRSFLSAAGTTRGHWAPTYTASGNGYTVAWTWVASAAQADATDVTLYCYPSALATSATPYQVTATVTDAKGVVSNLTSGWSFTVAGSLATTTAPAASVPTAGCAAGCHNGVLYSAAPGMGANCALCHSNLDAPPHGFIIGLAHTHADLAASMSLPTDSSFACTACHGTDFTNIQDLSGTTALYPTPYSPQPQHSGCSCHSYGEATDSVTGCVSCHKGAYGPHGFNTYAVSAAGTGTAGVASGHNTPSYSGIGAKTLFDGSQGVTITWSVSASGTIAGTTPAAAGANGTFNTGQTGVTTSTWSFPTQSVFWNTQDNGYSGITTDDVAPANAMTGLSASSVITCTDCHTGLLAAGPHGAAQNFGIDPNYPGDYGYAALTKYVTDNMQYSSATLAGQALDTSSGGAMHLVIFNTKADALAKTNPYAITDPAAASSPYFTPLSTSGIAMMSNVTTGGALIDRTDGTKGANAVICAKCHDLENFNYNSWAVEGANTAHDSHHQDVTGGVAQCVSCHIAIPHGWKRPRLLVDTAVDSYPYVSNKEMGASAGSGAVPASMFAGAATNGVGMLSLSAINNHPTGGTGQEPYSNGSSGSNVGAVTSTTTYTSFNPDGSVAATGLTYNPGHVGLAYWNEAQCAACNDHNSSGGVDTATGPRIK